MSRFLTLPLLALLVWSFLAAWSPAQDGIPGGSKAETETKFKEKQADFKKFLEGLEVPSNKKDQEVFDIAAKFYAYRLQWTGARGDSIELGKNVSAFEKDVIGQLLQPEAFKSNQEARNLVGRTMATRYQEVLNLDMATNRLSVVHAALSLPALAKLKQDDVGDLLTRLVADKDKHDAIKLYAFKSMREYFPAQLITDDDDPTDKKLLARARRDLARIETLIQFIETKRPTPAEAGTAAEKAVQRQELDAIRFVRKEAIHALAQAQVPALLTHLKKKGAAPLADLIKEYKGEGAVAATLMRVLVKGGLQPEASLAEKIEAAHGLCHLQCGKMPAYQPEMGVYLVCRTLDEYVRTFNADINNLFKPVDVRKPPEIAWKYQSERLRLGLDQLANNCKETSAKEKAAKIAREGKEFMGLVGAYKNLQNPNALRGIAETVRPTTNALFKGIPGPEIDPGE